MITIEKESEEFFANLKVYEHCIFCDKQTDTWNTSTNRPICIECAKQYKTSDIKTAPFNY